MNVGELLDQLRAHDADLPVALDCEGTYFNLGTVSGFINPEEMPDVVLTASQFVPTVKLNGHLRYELSEDWVNPDGRVQVYMADGDDMGAYWEAKPEVRLTTPAEAKSLGAQAVVITAGGVICC